MSTSSDDNAGGDKNTPGDKRIARGATTMKQVLRSKAKGEKIYVAWNERGQPILPGGPTLASYVGAITRQMVPITIESWRDPELKQIKENIWEDIKECFDIDDERKKYVLMSAGKLHRWFRSYIKTHYLYNEDGDVNEEPPAKYASFITEDIWREFIYQRTNDDFMETSARNKQLASNPEYPYRSSRTGYAYIEQQLMNQAEPGAPPPGRHTVWKQARVNKKGELADETSREVVEEIVRLSHNPDAEGEEESGLDILAKALPKQEYPGRVRGMGFGVSQRDYQQIKKNKKKDKMEKMMEELQGKVQQMQAELSAQRQTAAQPRPPTFMSMGIAPCVLYMATPAIRAVAKGKVHIGDPMLHNSPLPPDHAKVLIEAVIESGAPLPYPDPYGELTFVDQAIGCFIAWPLQYICCGDIQQPAHPNISTSLNEPAHPNVKGKGVVQTEFPPPQDAINRIDWCDVLRQRCTSWANSGRSFSISFDDAVFGESTTDFIGFDEVNEVLSHREISASVMCLYIRFLFTEVMDFDKKNKFFFLSPHRTWEFTEATSQFVGRKFCELCHDQALFLAPVNIGTYWVLLAMSPSNNTIYYLDSLRKTLKKFKDLSSIFNSAIRIYHSEKGISMSKKKSAIKWNHIECPKQKNGIDCGYYVMRFMKEIISMDAITIPDKYFSEYNFTTYTEDHLSEVKDEWAKYFIDNYESI